MRSTLLTDESGFGGFITLVRSKDNTLRDQMGFMFTQDQIDEIRYFLDLTEKRINKAGVDVDQYNKDLYEKLMGGVLDE